MKKYLPFILLLFFSCSSTQILKSANRDDLSTEEKRTGMEIDRTKDLVNFIKDTCLSDSEKKFIIKQIKYKDEQLKIKDLVIARKTKEIEAYQKESEKAVNKCEEKQDDFIQEQKDCLIDAGYGRSFKMIIYVGLGIFVLFLVYIAMKKGLFGLIKGG